MYFNVPHWRQDHPFKWLSELYKGPAIFGEKAIYPPLLEENWTELTFVKNPRIVTGDAPFSYLPIFSCPIFTVPGVFANVNLAQFFSHFLAANAITEILYYIKPPSQISAPPPPCRVCTMYTTKAEDIRVAPLPPPHTHIPSLLVSR